MTCSCRCLGRLAWLGLLCVIIWEAPGNSESSCRCSEIGVADVVVDVVVAGGGVAVIVLVIVVGVDVGGGVCGGVVVLAHGISNNHKLLLALPRQSLSR